MPFRSLSLALALLLTACGESPVAHYEADPQAAGQAALQQSFESALDIELDDAALGKLLATHERVLAQGGDVRGAMAAAGDWEGYGKAMIKWRAMRFSAKRRGPPVTMGDLEVTPELQRLVKKWEPRFQAVEEKFDD